MTQIQIQINQINSNVLELTSASAKNAEQTQALMRGVDEVKEDIKQIREHFTKEGEKNNAWLRKVGFYAVWNSNPNTGNPIGWVNTAAGWKGFGTIL